MKFELIDSSTGKTVGRGNLDDCENKMVELALSLSGEDGEHIYHLGHSDNYIKMRVSVKYSCYLANILPRVLAAMDTKAVSVNCMSVLGEYCPSDIETLHKASKSHILFRTRKVFTVVVIESELVSNFYLS